MLSEESFQQDDDEFIVDTDIASMLEEYSLPTSFGKTEVRKRRKSRVIIPDSNLKHGKGSRRNKIFTEHHKFSRIEPFDICPFETRMFEDKVYETGCIVCCSSTEMKDDDVGVIKVEQLIGESEQRVLRPGMILLKNFISHNEQVLLIRKCRELGLGPGGFYQPGYNDRAKLRLQMMCLGLDWDPQTRKYRNRRRVDGSKPADIPHQFHLLVERAIQSSHTLLRRDYQVCNPQEIIPLLYPDICIVNFYSETGRLGLHQDRDESVESLAKGLPVVSLSLGDSAEFLYGDDRDPNKAEQLLLKSGDVLIFGGKSRHVFHGITCVIPNSSPQCLLQETGFRPGRLNLTFRQY